MNKLFFALLLTASLAPAPAVILLNESFDYTNGPLVTVSGGVWLQNTGTAGQLDVESGVVNLNSLESEDVATPHAASSSNILYARFTVRCTDLPGADGTYFAHFSNGGSTHRGKIWALIGGAASGKFRLGLSSTSTASIINQTNTTDLDTNVTYTVVVRLTNTTGVASFWIDPTSESDPATTTDGETTSSSGLGYFALRQAGGYGAVKFDDLVVATTFNEALTGTTNPEPPLILVQPVSQTVTQDNNVTFSVVAAGTPPLSYQWSFAGTNVSGATNTFLELTNAQPELAGEYSVLVTNIYGATNSEIAELTVYIPPPPPPPPVPLTPVLSVLNYNAHGNFVADWTTNNYQVRAIGRQVQYLQPDIVTFQEIPMTNNGWAKMPDFVATYLPGYQLAINSGTDGYIRSAIVSRHPILRSQSWLARMNLSEFGVNANFARDLFEAEIAVPDFEQPLHVFTTHLKSGTSSSADAARRAAEASAISNFLITVFLPSNPAAPYLLTGDLNEDIARPATGSQQPIQRLVKNATGLHLTTPTNLVTGSELTFSIQNTNGLTRRYDYILPGGLMFSNIASNFVFRSDVLSPLPPNLFSNDSRNGSDHLPVMMWFGNPYATPFRLLSAGLTGGDVTLKWETMSNRVYGVEASTNLSYWVTLASNLVAEGTNMIFTTNAAEAAQFYRVFRLP